MIELTPFVGYNLLMASLTIVGVCALRYYDEGILYDRFLTTTVGGLLLFAVAGPVADLFVPRTVHWIHGIAAVLVVVGLFDPVTRELRRDGWMRLLLSDPSRIRASPEWMTPMDDSILELFHSSQLVLTPAVVALNIDRSRAEVNRRLGTLDGHGLVEKVDRGKYRLTDRGERYLDGRLRFGS